MTYYDLKNHFMCLANVKVDKFYFKIYQENRAVFRRRWGGKNVIVIWSK